MRFKKSTTVQSILFNKEWWSVTDAKAWLSANGYKSTPDKGSSRSKYHRFRQEKPEKFDKKTFRTIEFGNQIKAVIGVEKQKRKNPTTGISIPSTLVILGECLEIFLENAVYEPKGSLLCSNVSGSVLFVLMPGRKLRDMPAGKRAAAAARLYSRFTNFEADMAQHKTITDTGKTIKVGRVLGISYVSDKFSHKKHNYLHTFKHYPLMSADSKKNPGIIRISGGKIGVERRGITG